MMKKINAKHYQDDEEFSYSLSYFISKFIKSPEIITLISSRVAKHIIYQKLMPSVCIERKHLSNLPTFENYENVTELALKRAREAWKHLKKPLLIEENLVYIIDAPNRSLLITDFHKTIEENYGRKEFAQTYHDKKMKIETAIVYSPNGYDYFVTTDELNGTVKWVGENKWDESSCGWNSFLVPSGFKDITLGELYSQELLSVDLRSLPIIELYYDFISYSKLGGVYEIHITIENYDRFYSGNNNYKKSYEGKTLNRFSNFCDLNGLRCLLIKENNQLELQTAQYRTFKSSKDAHRAMKETAKLLSENGFIVKRSRLEAMAFNFMGVLASVKNYQNYLLLKTANVIIQK